MLKRGIILTSILLMMSTLLVARSDQENKLVDEIGQMLANWSTAHQTTIRINDQPISFTGGPLYVMHIEQTPDGPRRVCRGQILVFWQIHTETAEKNREIRDNLRSLIEKSRCDSEMLSTYASKLNETNDLSRLDAERLARDLRCLGKFEFTPIELK